MDNSHFAALMLWEVVGGERYWLVVDYYLNRKDWEEKKNRQVKFPGGGGGGTNEFPGETPFRTAWRESKAEIGLWPPEGSACAYQSPPKPSDRGEGTHTQYFFVARLSECSGALRMHEPLFDHGSYLSKPYLVREEELLESIFPSHRPGLESGIALLEGGGGAPSPPRPAVS